MGRLYPSLLTGRYNGGLSFIMLDRIVCPGSKLFIIKGEKSMKKAIWITLAVALAVIAATGAFTAPPTTLPGWLEENTVRLSK